jgi:hypothetical protein
MQKLNTHIHNNTAAKLILGPGPFIKNSETREIYGFILYVIIFLLIIPYSFYKFAPIFIMYYMANVDIIANILTTIKHPNIFGSLYLSEPDSIIQYISVIGINYVALISLFYVVIRLHEKIKTTKAIAVASVMTLVTFLLPTYIIPLFIKKVEEWLEKKNLGETSRVVISYIIGLATGIAFIFVEKEIIENFIL